MTSNVLTNLKTWLENIPSNIVDKKTTLAKIAELEKDEENSILNKSILDEDLGLTVRAVWCLKNANIHTLGELTEKTENEFISSVHIGKKSLAEIKEMLASHGLAFKGGNA